MCDREKKNPLKTAHWEILNIGAHSERGKTFEYKQILSEKYLFKSEKTKVKNHNILQKRRSSNDWKP